MYPNRTVIVSKLRHKAKSVVVIYYLLIPPPSPFDPRNKLPGGAERLLSPVRTRENDWPRVN